MVKLPWVVLRWRFTSRIQHRQVNVSSSPFRFSLKNLIDESTTSFQTRSHNSSIPSYLVNFPSVLLRKDLGPLEWEDIALRLSLSLPSSTYFKFEFAKDLVGNSTAELFLRLLSTWVSELDDVKFTTVVFMKDLVRWYEVGYNRSNHLFMIDGGLSETTLIFLLDKSQMWSFNSIMCHSTAELF